MKIILNIGKYELIIRLKLAVDFRSHTYLVFQLKN